MRREAWISISRRSSSNSPTRCSAGSAKDYGFEQRKQIIHSAAGVSDEAWSALAELGMTALPVPEAQGGFNGSAVDMLVVMQELGRGLVVEPYWATVLGAEFLKRAGGHEAMLEQVASRRTEAGLRRWAKSSRAMTCSTSPPRPKRRAAATS